MECGACAINCPTEAVRVTPGVGCASYIIQGWIKGKDNASCCC
jgi:ferredoxin